ncbi:hypothetical protein [Enterobacter cloacae]|uniref:thiolase family protein n=1 Tax=Enterobacter cloacae TaxID=550 RepID=UPI0034CF96BF
MTCRSKGTIVFCERRNKKAIAAINTGSLAKLWPAVEGSGTATAGKASGINDAAATLVLMYENAARAQDITTRVQLKSWASTGAGNPVHWRGSWYYGNYRTYLAVRHRWSGKKIFG